MDRKKFVLAGGGAAALAFVIWRRRGKHEAEPAPPGGWPAHALDRNIKADAPEDFSHPVFPNLASETAKVLKSRRVFTADDVLTLWDGSKRTGPQHLDWMLQHVKEHTSNVPGFRATGCTDGVSYEIHDELTAKGDGYGYFRLSAVVDVSPSDFTAAVMNPLPIAAVDPTLRYMSFKTCVYPDGRTWLVYWRAHPPAPLLWDLDGLDLTTYRTDPDGTIWQVSVSVPHEVSRAQTAVRAVDMYWGYKLEPIDGGRRTNLTLVCQTALYNSLPLWLSNRFVGQTLADYVRSIERGVLAWHPSGKLDAFKVRAGFA